LSPRNQGQAAFARRGAPPEESRRSIRRRRLHRRFAPRPPANGWEPCGFSEARLQTGRSGRSCFSSNGLRKLRSTRRAYNHGAVRAAVGFRDPRAFEFILRRLRGTVRHGSSAGTGRWLQPAASFIFPTMWLPGKPLDFQGFPDVPTVRGSSDTTLEGRKGRASSAANRRPFRVEINSADGRRFSHGALSRAPSLMGQGSRAITRNH